MIKFINPWMLWCIPGVALLLLLVITRNFVKLALSPEDARKQRRARVWVFISRLLIISLLLLALAQPFTETTKEVQGNPRLTILIDQSASTKLLDTSFAEELAEKVGKSIPTTVRYVGTNLTSDVGSAVLRNLDPGGNILLISDGQANAGSLLSDVAFYAVTVNSTISIINLTAAEEDAAVVITGPGKVVAESDASFAIDVTTTKPEMQVQLEVFVDGVQALNRQVGSESISFTQQFTKGTHKIEARISTADAIAENNVFYKTVHVLPKPKILLLSRKNSPVELLLRELYEVEKRGSLPADLTPYYAIVVNDMPVETLVNSQALHNYLIDESGQYYGNGIIFFGGLNSFDRGGYSGSSLESILPVKVGKGERKKGEAALVFVIDVSGSTTRTKYRNEGGQLVEYQDAVPTLDVIKAQVVNAIEQLKIDNKLGIIVFGVPANTESSSIEERLADTVRRVATLDYLYNNRKDVLENIPRIQGGGPTAADVAFRAAVDMLKPVKGDKNIILLTDGRYSAGLGADSPMKQELLTMAENARRLYGINFMTIGVGTSDAQQFTKKVDESFLKDLAKAGDGTYDRATRLQSLLIKWGDPKSKEYGEEFSLVPLSLTHFITRDIEPNAVLNGYNEVVPKDTAELLIAADSGQPALTTWRYGNGRVGTWTVFAGNNLGQLLNNENSLLISRSVNWAIGDPQRKEAYFVDIDDVRTNKEGHITVRSDSPVTSEGLTFSKEGNRYTARFTSPEAGFQSLLGQLYATNRPSELDAVGINTFLEEATRSTGGKVFKPSESEAIIKHVKEASRKVTLSKNIIVLPLLIAAMALLLIEILVRRLTRRRD